MVVTPPTAAEGVEAGGLELGGAAEPSAGAPGDGSPSPPVAAGGATVPGTAVVVGRGGAVEGDPPLDGTVVVDDTAQATAGGARRGATSAEGESDQTHPSTAQRMGRR
jgi:hypothetical protein